MTAAIELFWGNLSGFMSWNLFLAIIPYALSFILFAKRSPKRLPLNPIWWFGVAIFILLAHLGLRGKWYSVDTIIGDMVGL